jgi:hypothetical protein
VLNVNDEGGEEEEHGDELAPGEAGPGHHTPGALSPPSPTRVRTRRHRSTAVVVWLAAVVGPVARLLFYIYFLKNARGVYALAHGSRLTAHDELGECLSGEPLWRVKWCSWERLGDREAILLCECFNNVD